jgi:hypothetical protein
MNRHRSQPSAIQLVDDSHDRSQLVVRRVRRWDRLAARALASSLDRQLAAGRSPESTHLLATRAAQLASVAVRRELVRNFDHLLELVERTAAAPGARVLASREAIAEAEPDLREMLTKLATPLPTSARGVAMARILLTDGTGPLFRPRCPTNLRRAVQDAIAQLDQAGSAGDIVTLFC